MRQDILANDMDDILDVAVNPDPTPVSHNGRAPAMARPLGLEKPPTSIGEIADVPSPTGLLLREVVETVVLTLVIFLLIRMVVQNYRIEGQSMEPNFHDGQYLIVNKLAYILGAPARGDVIVFHYPRDPERDFIKRVVALPGDTVSIRDNTVYVNGAPVLEPYSTNPINYEVGPVIVDPNTLYVLGDNRPNSEDSHRWGLLPQDLVIGKAWVSVWPMSDWGVVPHAEPVAALPAAMRP